MGDKLKHWRKDGNWLPGAKPAIEMERLSDELERCTEARARWKAARALSHAAASLAFNDALLDLDNVERSVAALRLAHRNGGATEFSGKAASFLARERLALLGIGDPETVFEKRKRVRVDCGCLAVGTDPKQARDWLLLNGTPAVEALNRGDLYVLGIGGDGTLSVRLRMVTGEHPVLTAKEYAAVTETGPIGYLKAGTLMAGEAAAIEKGVAFKVSAPVLVQPFALNRSGSPSVIFVICTAQSQSERLNAVPELQV